MESTTVEDFQDYHNDQHIGDADEVRDSSQSHNESALDTDHSFEDDEASLSGSAHHSSGPDEIVFDHPSRASSPGTSNGSGDEISILESHHEPDIPKLSPFTPTKTRSAFRHPSSVRAMQMDTTPPHLSTPSSQHRHKLYTPSRHYTPHSSRFHRSVMSSPSGSSPTKKLKKEYPLVLLHITLLRIPLLYSQEVLEAVLPPTILENWKILQEKATTTVLERGILIPHPKEDYDLLEERLLESLELKTPRVLKCGHFHLSPEEEADIAENGSEDEDLDDNADDPDICLDCGRRVRNGRYGSAGTGNKRWDIKLFAANGLMRAGAWSAAWREMERVDVEIVPWMEEDMKRELELRKEEEERVKAEAGEEGVGGLDDERLREIYGGQAQAFVDGFADETPATTEMAKRQTRADQCENVNDREGEVPLWELLRRYLLRMAQDRWNVAIFMLSILVLLLSIGSFPVEHAGTTMDMSQDSESVPAITTAFQPPSTQNSLTDSASMSTSTLLMPPTASSSSTMEPGPTHSPDPQLQQPEEEVPLTEAAQEELEEIIED